CRSCLGGYRAYRRHHRRSGAGAGSGLSHGSRPARGSDMRLGFTVPELLRAGRGGGALRMGLRRVAESDWLWPDFDRAERAAAFDAHSEAVREQPGAADAVHELAAML